MRGLDEAIALLFRTAAGSEKVMARTFHRIGSRSKDRAKEYAPRSPTLSDLRKDAKARGSKRKFKIRKATGTSRPKPGGLENSIDYQTDALGAIIFVSANSEAGDYAFRIHEQKGQSWHKRGIGTVSKGSKADDKFIVRAIQDTEGENLIAVADEQAKAFRAAGW